MNRPLISLVLLLLVAGAAVVSSQEVIDRVAAIVNDDIILLSEIDETLFVLASRGQLAVRDSTELDAIRRQVLDELINNKLIIHRAESLGMRVSDADVAPQVEEAITRIQGNFEDERAFYDALEAEGVTLNMLRERYTTEFRNERMKQSVLGNEIRDQAEVTTEDVQAYYQERKDELPTRSDDMHLRHMLFRLDDEEQDAYSYERAAAVSSAVVGGASFAQATEGLQAVTTPQRFCAGDLAPEIEQVIMGLAPGDVSPPVRGAVGYNVFQLMSREENCFEVVYTVVPLETSPESREAALAKAEAARQRVLDGEAFGDVARDVSEDPMTRESGGDMGYVTVDGVPPDIAQLLDALELNTVSEVVEAPDGFHVFLVLDRREGGEYTFEEIEQQLRQYLAEEKFQTAYQEWLAAVRDSSYVEIKTWTR